MKNSENMLQFLLGIQQHALQRSAAKALKFRIIQLAQWNQIRIRSTGFCKASHDIYFHATITLANLRILLLPCFSQLPVQLCCLRLGRQEGTETYRAQNSTNTKKGPNFYILMLGCWLRSIAKSSCENLYL